MSTPLIHRRRAYTLIELLLALALTTVLMSGLASAMVLASRAIPDASSPGRLTLNSYRAAEHLTAELFAAQSVTERTATSIMFSVADRDDPDSIAETIAYSWSGVSGDPLTRTYNAEPAETVAADVREFSLQYATRVETTTETQTVTGQSAEFSLASFIGWDGIAYSNMLLGPGQWMAEYFEFVFPEGVTTLNITRAMVTVSSSTSDTSAYVTAAIHPAVAGNVEPESAPIGTPATIMASTLTSTPVQRWFLFSDVTITAPGAAGYSLVVKGNVLGAGSGQYQYWKTAPADVPQMVYTSDGGASWDPRASARDDYDMPFYIYATYPTDTTQDVVTNQYFLQTVTITLLAGTDNGTPIRTAVSVMNEPEVPGP